MDRRVLITGGAGFIGSHVVDEFLKEGFNVIAVDDLSSGKRENLDPSVSLEIGDITNKEFISDIFKKYRIEYVIHHAAQIDVRKSVSDPIYDANINIMGLLNLLELSKEYKIKKFVFASSGGVVYGEPSKLPVGEEYPKGPLSPYGVSKLSSEYYLYYYCKTFGIPYVALRYGNVYGPRQDPHGEAGVIAIFIGKILENKELTVFGTGEQVRDYVFVKDVAKINRLSVELEIEGESIDDFAFNIGTGIGTSVNELINYLKELTGYTLPPIYRPPRKGELQKIILNPKKAERVFGISSWIGMKEGLKITYDWFAKRNERDENFNNR